MHRPTRQHATLAQKIAEKEARSHKKKPGKKAKRYKKWAATYQPLAQG
ncbi:MAG TPA: hypothetical protein VHB21_17230 [Minicystis sp.]|nr:hypothetical protein [Minicystis sp.]